MSFNCQVYPRCISWYIYQNGSARGSVCCGGGGGGGANGRGGDMCINGMYNS